MKYSDVQETINRLTLTDLSILASDLAESLDDVVLNESNPNFEGRNTNDDFDIFVRGLSNVEFFGLLHKVLRQIESAIAKQDDAA